MNNDFFNREVVTTDDGFTSIFLPAFNEHYHSTHGAVQESNHVFMKMGWEPAILNKKEIAVLEIGFGTGLNAWLVLLDTKWNESRPKVLYTTLEAFPVAYETARQLNYASAQESNAFMAMHEAEWNVPVVLHERFTLRKKHISLNDFIPEQKNDLIFFDAFAPRVQPELWTREVFDKMFAALNPGGILVTYCAKGEVRRTMLAAGFTVERVPGPPGKREMLRATKPA